MSSISVSELKKASDNLFYEIWMLESIYEYFAKRNSPEDVERETSSTHTPTTVVISRSTGVIKSGEIPTNIENQVLNNSLIEAFAIHARVLLDFFYKPRTKDDVIAEDFFPQKENWNTVRLKKSESELEKITGRVDKEIAHLTYSRQTRIKKEWEFDEIYKEIKGVIDAFTTNVSEDVLGDRWKM